MGCRRNWMVGMPSKGTVAAKPPVPHTNTLPLPLPLERLQRSR